MRSDGTQAWSNALGNKSARWEKVAGRLRADFVTVAVKPKFRLSAADKFFCAGSCFARNIEEHLIYRDIPVLSRRIVSPKEEYPKRPTGIVNKFTTASILNELKWLVQPHDPEEALVETQKGWVDLQLMESQPPVSLERGIERRRYIESEYFPRIREADVVVMTLGLTEVWFDALHEIYLNAAPPLWSVRRSPARFWFERTDVAFNLGALEDIHALLKRLNPAAKIVVTVSPVPLDTTFTSDDILVANTYSKSALRAAAQAFAEAHDDVDYFPSYELVMLSRRDAAFWLDYRHVEDEAVGRVVSAFISSYIGDVAVADPEFHEPRYLEANPDVEESVRAGLLASGFEHWKLRGRVEGRPLRLRRPAKKLRGRAGWGKITSLLPVWRRK